MPRMNRFFLTKEEKAKAPKVTWALIRRVLSWFVPYWKQGFLTLLCILCSSLFRLLPSILSGRIIDDGLVGQNLRALILYIVLSILVTVLGGLIGIAERYLNQWISQHIGCDMRGQMFRHLERMSTRFFTTRNQGEIITRMTSDIDGVERVTSTTLAQILSNVMTLIVAFVAMFRRSPLMAFLSLIIVPLVSLPVRQAGQRRWYLAHEVQEVNDGLNGILNETMSVSGQLLVKLFGREEAEYQRYTEANTHMMRLNIRESLVGGWFRVLLSLFGILGPMMIYLVSGLMMIRYGADLTVGDVAVLVALVGEIYGPVNGLLNIQSDWIRSMAMFTRIFEYFDLPVEIENAPDAQIPAQATGRVSFRGVCFGYEEGKEILHDVSFDLESGHSVAIVGPSGSGKSTIVNLIPRLYDVGRGAVLFEDVDVRKLDLGWLRSQIGVVSQDSYLFNGTIRDNLRYACPDATESQLIDACKRANIYDFIEAQADGFDAVVGNRGLKLSGGEKQRISIARALLKDPALLIFDEATSALDSISEARIQEAIEPIIQSRTSILIAHRLSTILAADEILVVKDGRIVERGKHPALVAADGVYAELYRTQFSAALK